MEHLDFPVKQQPTVQNTLQNIRAYLNTRVLGQEELVLQLLIALLANGHILLEGAPGLAKTRAVKELASVLEADFQRIQFTPDLLPSDLTGTDIYRPETGSFQFQKGPLFHHLILADEINRAPAKVQSALLEAMAENQITIGGKTYALGELFLVIATQNPIEQEGTYTLPEAQLDRFLMHVKVDYPTASIEQAILQLAREEAKRPRLSLDSNSLQPGISPLSAKRLFEARKQVLSVHTSEALDAYMVQLILATRKPEAYSQELAAYIRFGASPRATLALDNCSKAHAFLCGRDYVKPEDIHAVIYPVLAHRIILRYEAQAEGLNSYHIIEALLKLVAVP